MRHYFVLLALFSLTFSNPLNSSTNYLKKYRLPGTVKPTFYSLKIQPNIEEGTFVGEVSIHVQIDVSVEFIEFHSSNLNINSLHFNLKKVRYIPEIRYCNLAWDNLGYEFLDHQLIRVRYGCNNWVPPGSHVIHIKYDGRFSKTTEGIFRTGFSKNGTVLSYVVATDFEPCRAREVFPCFDEPALKARFQLTLVVPNKDYTALSNMNLKQKIINSNEIVYKFATTPPMSTYLLSFVISQHSCKKLETDRISYGLCTFNGQNEDNLRFLNFSSQVIQFYEGYTTVDYALPKIDFVGYDRTETAATENWGLITLNSSLLSADSDLYTDSQKFSVIAHELAHFWFGNLVTNSWWDGIWLQEGLATFMAFKSEEHVLKNSAWKFFPQLYMDSLFWSERTKDSTPVMNYQVAPEKIRENFNDITYNKAATVLRMLETVIGPDLFQKAVIKYIKDFAFKSASSEDFLSVFESVVSNEGNLREFMETYFYQSKYPVLLVEEDGDNYVLTQRSCCQQQEADSLLGAKWTIPLTYVTDDLTVSSTEWFNKDMESWTLPKKGIKWVKFNYRQIGYYRVNYTDSLWQALMDNVQDVEPYERDLLLLEASDLFALDLTSCETFLKYVLEVGCSVSRQGPINVEYFFLAYSKLSEKLIHDAEAYKELNNYLGLLSRLMKKRFLVNYFSRNNADMASVEMEKQTEEASPQTKSCAIWIKSNSMEYFHKRIETTNDTFSCVSKRPGAGEIQSL